MRLEQGGCSIWENASVTPFLFVIKLKLKSKLKLKLQWQYQCLLCKNAESVVNCH
jgi:hypothetical protein